MTSERLITGGGAVLFAVLAMILWGDYLRHSNQVYGQRSAAEAQIKQIEAQLATIQNTDQLDQLNTDEANAQLQYQDAERRINDMDGWNSLQWKVKNSLRLASPVAAVVLAAFLVLALLNPLKPDS